MKLGIDFGSTYTYIYKYTENEGLEDAFNSGAGIYCDEGAQGIPTLIQREGTKVKIGKEVEYKKELLLKDRFRVHYDPIVGKALNYEGLTEDTIAFFNEIIKAAGIDKREVFEIVFGVPVTTAWEEATIRTGKSGVEKISYADNMINDVFKVVFPKLRRVQYLEEPILAGLSELSSDEKITEKDIVLVADFGGGTNDFALIQKKNDGTWYVIKSFGGGSGYAGRDLDVAIQKEIETGRPYKIALQSVRVLKETLFKEDLRGMTIYPQGIDGGITVYYGNANGGINIAPAVNVWIEGAIDDLDTFYEDFIEDHKNNAATHLIFAGGSSNIRPLRDAFFDRINAIHTRNALPPIIAENVRVVSDPASAVARGAAMYNLKNVSESEEERPQEYYLCLTNGEIESTIPLYFCRDKGESFYYSLFSYSKNQKGIVFNYTKEKEETKEPSYLEGENFKFFFKKGNLCFPLDGENGFFEIDFPVGSGMIFVAYPDPMKTLEQRTLYFWVIPTSLSSNDVFFEIKNAVYADIEMYSFRGKIDKNDVWSLSKMILKKKKEE